MKKGLFILLLNAVMLVSYSQSPDTLECTYPDMDTTELEALPWFGNNDYLVDFLDSIGYPGPQARIVDNVRFWIPVKFWVYRNSMGTGGPTLANLQTYIDNLNRFFNQLNNTWIGFYMKCDVTYINDDDFLTISDFEGQVLTATNQDVGAMNVHIADNLNNATGVTYSFIFGSAIFLSRDTYTGNFFASTIAHEAGHFFGLQHTHQYSNRGMCRKEPIDRTRTWPFFRPCIFNVAYLHSNVICETNGDLLRDTPADPDLNNNTDNVLCLFEMFGWTDPWGDHYETPPAGSLSPDTRNLMSYNRRRPCRDRFSELQIAVMLHTIFRGKFKKLRIRWEDTRSTFDSFEPDNVPETARPILVSEVQARNFHQQYEGGTTWTSCDVDWVRFVAPVCNGAIEVFTSAIPGRTNANTRLTLFDNAMTQLAQNDDISGSNLFSSITWTFVTGQTYFIRVENMSPGVTGYYNLQMGAQSALSIQGNPIICNSENYLINNLPAGSVVTWSIPAAAGSVLQLTPNPPIAPQITVTNQHWYTVATTLNASVNTGCGNPVDLSLPIANDNDNSNIQYGSYYQEACTFYNVSHPSESGNLNGNAVFLHQGCMIYVTLYGMHGRTVSLAPGSGTPMYWSYSGPNSSGIGTLYLQLPLGSGGVPFVFNINGNGACYQKSILFFSIGNNGRNVFTISPNPARDILTINAIPGDGTSKADLQFTANIYDLFTSRLLFTKRSMKGTVQETINVSGLSKGYYVIEIKDGDKVQTFKFFKE